MDVKRLREEEGMALLVATLFVSLALVALGSLAMRVINQSNQVEKYISYEGAFLGVENGLAECRSSLMNDGDGRVGVGDGVQVDGAPSFDLEGVTPKTIPGMRGVEYLAHAVSWENDGIDNNGDGMIDGVEEKWYYTLYAAGRLDGVTRSVEMVMGGEDVNVWRNAIFAGAGQAGGLINGNVSIHGSVHLLGEQLLPGNEAITALDLSGTSLIHNNYVGCPVDLFDRVPALPQRALTDGLSNTLEAKLRCKHGLVGLSGNSEIGEPDVAGNGVKEMMDGCYVTDGWTGNAVIDDGDRGDPLSVYSDNGWDEEYDLGDQVPMPLLTDDWKDPVDGHKEWDGSRSENYTHEHFFDEVLVGDPADPADGVYNGDITIDCATDFYYNASRPGDPDPANRLPDDDYILFDAATNVMEINGQITVNGDFELTRGGGNDNTINYTGRAALLVHGNVTLDTHLLSVNADGTTANSFPENNCLGIMAEQDMAVGSSAQLTLMGAFYAQGTVSSSKQTITMGTFVANYFDMGTNVPEIYQVPSLADHLPEGMIGAYPILAFERMSWRELTS